MQKQTGAQFSFNVEELPDNEAEAEIFLNNNIKSDAEVAAQIAVDMTLSWSNFNDNTFRRAVQDLASIGMAVIKRTNDPSYGITTKYIDPKDFVHSYSEDPGFTDLTYGGHIKSMPIQELRRLAGDELTEDDHKEIAKKTNSSASLGSRYDSNRGSTIYDYDENTVDVLEFEFLSTDVLILKKRKSIRKY